MPKNITPEVTANLAILEGIDLFPFFISCADTKQDKLTYVEVKDNLAVVRDTVYYPQPIHQGRIHTVADGYYLAYLVDKRMPLPESQKSDVTIPSYIKKPTAEQLKNTADWKRFYAAFPETFPCYCVFAPVPDDSHVPVADQFQMPRSWFLAHDYDAVQKALKFTIQTDNRFSEMVQQILDAEHGRRVGILTQAYTFFLDEHAADFMYTVVPENAGWDIPEHTSINGVYARQDLLASINKEIARLHGMFPGMKYLRKG